MFSLIIGDFWQDMQPVYILYFDSFVFYVFASIYQSNSHMIKPKRSRLLTVFVSLVIANVQSVQTQHGRP